MAETTLHSAARIARALNALRTQAGPRIHARRDVSLAKALLWPNDQLERRDIDVQDLKTLTRVNAGGQGIAVFSYAAETPTNSLLRSSALYAYQASIDWGIVGNENELTIFNSHWTRKGLWFSLPSIRWDKIEGALDIFAGLTPDGLTTGLIDRIAARFPSPDTFLLPVDDALVARLDFWRLEMARYAPTLQRADEMIHKLFAQLFVLRAAEDRKLALGLDSLLSCREDVYSHGVDTSKLRNIFRFASTHLQTELFSTDNIQEIPCDILAGVIDDLYYPRHLPSESAVYNFSWIDADVLGRAYEKYLSGVLTSSSAPPQMRLLQTAQPLRNIETSPNRKASGTYYTPSFLVSYLVKESIDRYYSEGNKELPRIIDPTCGSGSFLTASVSYLSQMVPKKERTRDWTRKLIKKRLICGIDSDPRAVLLAKLSLWLRLAEEPHPLPLPALDDVIIQGDALQAETWNLLPESFSIVVGNPPFIPNSAIDSKANLEKLFVSARGRFDYAYLFLEMALKKLATGGKVAMVLPNRIFRARDAGAARNMVATTATLNVVTDFGSNEVFKGVNAYIGTLIATKGLQSSDETPVRFVRILEMAPRLMNLVLGAATKDEIATEYVQSFDIQRPTSSDAWLFLSPASRSARLRLEDRSILLSEIAEVFQGIKVGANDLFIIQILSDPSAPIVQVRNGLGEVHTLESNLLHPVVFGSQIEAYKHVNAGSYILYPYLRGSVIESTILESRFPLTFQYLTAYKPMLESRVSLVNSGRKWFELVRHRDQTKLESPKLMMRDLAMTTAFAIDDAGSTYLIGGTAIIPSDAAHLKPLLAYLNSVLTNWYLTPLTPSFQGDFQKFEPQHLSNIPVLLDIFEDSDLREKLCVLADLAINAKESDNSGEFEDATKSIDLLLCNKIGVDPRI